MIAGLPIFAQIAIFFALLVFSGTLLWLLALGVFKVGEKVEGVNRSRKQTYKPYDGVLKADEELIVLRSLRKFNSGHFEVVPKMRVKKVLKPQHIAKLRVWNHEKMKKEIDFVIYHKQNTNKRGDKEDVFLPICGIICPSNNKGPWVKWLDDAFMRAKTPLLCLTAEDLEEGARPIHEQVILKLASPGPVPPWTIDALKASLAPKFPPETLNRLDPGMCRAILAEALETLPPESPK